MSTNYEILRDEVTLHRNVGNLTHPVTGEKIGTVNGRGETFFLGEIVNGDELSPIYAEALENEDSPSHAYVAATLKKVSGAVSQNTGQRLGLPFEGYDEMDEQEIVTAMAVLPSGAIQRIKDYEALSDSPRSTIVGYSIGYGQDSARLQEDRDLSGLEETDADKATAKLKTRVVPEDGGLVEPGEGVTGTGDPEIPYGSTDGGDGPKPRRQRRRRPTPESPAEESTS